MRSCENSVFYVMSREFALSCCIWDTWSHLKTSVKGKGTGMPLGLFNLWKMRIKGQQKRKYKRQSRNDRWEKPLSIPNVLASVAYMIDMTVYSQGHPTNHLSARSKRSQEPPAVQCTRCSDSKGYGEMKMAA